ncbi:MAG TPA: NAD(P)/FAD-dependent oxidoreductase [Thermomicrobiales bacterium]|nr:NAD(P)/FAD-dependent oxidoreductase [Thermomicrobiales bacterium]
MTGLDNMGAAERPRVVIIGAGFAGLNAAKALNGAPVWITIIDRRNHHLFQPLLYQVATAVLSPADIASPIRRVFREQENVEVLLGEATAIDTERREVVLEGDRIAYDSLIVATGASHAYFGHDEWADFAPGLKSLEDALDIRRRILIAFEAAERSKDPAEREALMTFVIVGAGPTGVELAGAVAEMAHRTLANEFDHIDPSTSRIYLLEGADRVLPPFAPRLSQNARQELERLAVTVRTGTLATGIDAEGVSIGEERIPARTVLWAAGVRASPLAASLGVPLDRSGRVIVEPDLSIPGHPEVFVTGDLAAVTGKTGKPVPGIAPAAIQQGRTAAANVVRRINGEETLPFSYRDQGNMAVIARNEAVAEIKGLKLTGFIAWLVWALVHIANLIGFRNRIQVMTQWVWAYLTHQRGARLITEDPTPRRMD